MEELLGKLKEIGVGQIATVVGRYYAMDRDKRWERNELALKGMVLGEGEESSDPVKTIKERYEKGENDEFLKPIVVGGKEARIQGMLPRPTSLSQGNRSPTDGEQTTIPSSSSTTAPTASAR
jgi:bisphosphoglycerate-independent phosphoglycerate mutase (AlkP superfamily)